MYHNKLYLCCSYLGWQGHGFSLHNLRHIQVKEVTVEDRLDDSGDYGNDVIEAFEVIAIDPVENIECSI